MLRLDEFTVGDLSSAEAGLTLLLGRESFEPTTLTGSFSGQRHGVILDGDRAGSAYPIADDESWGGILVADVSIEVDPGSAFDPQATRAQVGALVRESEKLSIVAAVGARSRVYGPSKLILLEDLSPLQSRSAAGFNSWRVTIGHGADKRTLLAVDAKNIAAKHAEAR